MDRTKLVSRVRTLTRDFANSVFREADIVDFIDEGIDRVAQVIPELVGLIHLPLATSVPTLIPERFQHLLSIYASSRCFYQDERHYQATNLMNEFEVKLDEFKGLVQSGDVVIVDGTGAAVEVTIPVDYVETKSYWGDNHTVSFTDDDLDLGVEGVDS